MTTRDAPHAHLGEVPRRTFLGGAGALLLAGTASAHAPLADASPNPAGPQRRPNIIVLITDQERQPMYWPSGWPEANLPNRQRLADTGLTFTRSFCNTSMCSPSRSTFFTSLYPAQHGVTSTLTEGGTLSPTEPQLPLDLPNLATVLASAGYDVQYRGKWHMSKDVGGGEPTSADLAGYGFHGWIPPDYGGDTKPEHFGGGCADHDSAVAAQAAQYLHTVDTGGSPFALVVSFANPHDILAYPLTWNAQAGDCDNYGIDAPGCFRQGIDLPPTLGERLALAHKPTAQVQSQVLLNGLGPLLGEDALRNYVNFYAFTQKVVDAHIGTVLDAVESRPGLRADTLIIRIADHGEMGLSHGGLRQKIFNAYEETVRVPLVFSNPRLFPTPVRTPALASLIDVVPTLAALVQAPNPAQWRLLGTDLSPVIADAAAHPQSPTARVQDSVLFTFDDVNCGNPNGQGIVTPPNRIRAIREDRWMYAAYFDPSGAVPAQFELYDLQSDPTEVDNLADPLNAGHHNPQQTAIMHERLVERLRATGTMPARGL
ncbi:sulfatase-like hydrolase/transferase [Rhodococcus sp. D2-41]|uniref:Sulfatase-like hydrolase/transferase n=1 Tax=Speluncibacter jeojiensis TaxID=2710754 RepID=A0A9X4M3I6_9ACTN|nr:sulfatase-like hydrolase/transferase [Rhodococcus sp. D2-41]MDG3009447.1 sulfatase-like hydrolase/transferase [Rhodococcus sp. D2-41]MDG3016375.1 sulfatase-like hydrolase/transferase [Corynebacteriales bacterium D3-21]